MKTSLKIFAVVMMALAIPQSVKAYDFSYTYQGQTLYYNIVDGNAQVTYQRTSSPRYSNLSGDLVIPASVTYGGNTYAVTSIGELAFRGCSDLTSVTIPNAVTSIGGGAFRDCSGLTSIVVSSGNATYDSRNNCNAIIETSTNTLIAGCKNTIIPTSVTSIGGYAFAGCSGLTSVTIPDAVTSIGDLAFRDCYGLTSVNYTGTVAQWCNIYFSEWSSNPLTYSRSLNINGSPITNLVIPNGVTEIKQLAFFNCSGLTSVTIPDAVTSIDDYAFQYCSGLTSVTIGNGVTSIGENAFRDCSGLDTVYLMPATPPTLGDNVFYNNPTGRVFVLNDCSSYDNYYTSLAWSDYRNSLRILSEINVSVLSSNTTRGTASIIQYHGHNVSCDSTVVISATASNGYHFDHWSTGSTANPDTITLVGDSTVTAYFERNTYHLTANVNDATLGTVSLPQGDSALYLDTLMVVAHPVAHYHVASWQQNGGSIVATSADRNTVWVKLAGDCNLTCNFVIDTHTVSVATNDIARGTVESTGTEFVYGTPCTVTATAYTGYTFAGWSNGVNENPYTFAVLSDVELTALFVEEGEEVYTVTVVSADPTMGTVSGGGQSLDGGTVVIRATGNPGYRFVRWNDNNTDSVRTVEVHGNVTYTAYFEALQGIDDVAAKGIRMYAGDGEIVLEGSEGMAVSVYDMMGRKVFSVMAAPEPCKVAVMQRGVYLVKVGNLPARKVVVVR